MFKFYDENILIIERIFEKHLKSIQMIIAAFSGNEKYINKNDDLRINLLGRISNVISATALNLTLIGQHLYDESWWANTFQNPPTTEQKKHLIETNIHFLQTSFIISFYSVLESGFRGLVKYINPEKYPKQSDSMSKLLKIIPQYIPNSKKQYMECLKLMQAIRNSTHNNGVYFSNYEPDLVLTYLNQEYELRNGIELNIVTWELLDNTIEDVINILKNIIMENGIIYNAIYIPDLVLY
jgi:hypothetical protein